MVVTRVAVFGKRRPGKRPLRLTTAPLTGYSRTSESLQPAVGPPS